MPPSPKATQGPRVNRLRGAIDQIDVALSQAVRERIALAARIGLVKLVEGRPLNDPDREQAVVAAYAIPFEGSPRSRAFIEGWARTLIAHSAVVQRHPVIAYQGSAGSWSEESLLSRLPSAAALGCASFEGAWKLCRQGTADAAWLPLRNSTIGPIPEVAPIVEEAQTLLEMEYPVKHALLCKGRKKAREVTTIWGHPYALLQCKKTLADDFPKARRVPVPDAQTALPHLRRSPRGALVASQRFADLFDLQVLRPSIIDDARNRTRFVLVVPKADC